jgi:carbonic anhydrase
MAELDNMLEANEQHASGFDQGGLGMPPARAVAVVACMDARLHPAKFLGLSEGDAHVIRNAGGRASDDAIRSLIISSRLLGTREFAVVHHTDCGMLTFSNDDLRASSRRRPDRMRPASTSCRSGTSSRACATTSPRSRLHPSSTTTSRPGLRLRRQDGTADRGRLSPRRGLRPPRRRARPRRPARRAPAPAR